jgi:hypothetical protein
VTPFIMILRVVIICIAYRTSCQKKLSLELHMKLKGTKRKWASQRWGKEKNHENRIWRMTTSRM